MDLTARFIDFLRRQGDGAQPVFVGLDGRSGCGKSTLAAAAADQLAGELVVIEGDQFYAGGSATTWDDRSPEQKVSGAMDWRRQREVLTRLRVHGSAEWHPFDWDADDWDADDARLAEGVVRTEVAPLVLLEGAYSCRPELHDVLDATALLDVPTQVRRGRLLERDGADYRADWEGRWSEAEDLYFESLMPPDRFDLILVP